MSRAVEWLARSFLTSLDVTLHVGIGGLGDL